MSYLKPYSQLVEEVSRIDPNEESILKQAARAAAHHLLDELEKPCIKHTYTPKFYASIARKKRECSECLLEARKEIEG